MQEITVGTSEGAYEKHTPVYHINGETEHPMTPEHYIDWVCMEIKRGFSN